MTDDTLAKYGKVGIGKPQDSMTSTVDGQDHIKQEARYSKYFGTLSVNVYAPKRYYKMEIKRDWYSYGIVKSKSEDLSNMFYEDFKKAFDKIIPSGFDLITIIPKTNVGAFSPTMMSLCKRLSTETKIPFTQVLNRIRSPEKKMTDLGNVEARNKSNQGTIDLTNPELVKGKRVLVIDDVKTTGDTILTCAQLLINNGAKNVVGLCLGINAME
jgi:hypothetical protein